MFCSFEIVQCKLQDGSRGAATRLNSIHNDHTVVPDNLVEQVQPSRAHLDYVNVRVMNLVPENLHHRYGGSIVGEYGIS